MGKYILIKDADFSAVAVEQVTPRRYFFKTPESVFESADTEWNLNTVSYAPFEQTALANKKVDGIRLNVGEAGTMTIFKGKLPITDLKSLSDLTQVATATTIKTGIQDIDFSSSVVLGQNEGLVIVKSDDTLRGKFIYNYSGSGFYGFVGFSNLAYFTDKNLAIDFYEKLSIE